jgi:hypothetical protein
MELSTDLVNQTSPSQAKIALFRGREDVYPRRFESRTTGKAGYTASFQIKTPCRRVDSGTSSPCRSQKGPRKQDNSVFLDDQLVPWADQWAFLAGVRRIVRGLVEGIVQDAERRGRILGVRLPPQDDGEDEPWTAPPSRHRRESPIVGELPETLELVLGNQIYVAKEGLHHPLHTGLPRGCVDDLRQALTDVGVRTVIRDERYAGRPLDLTFQGELRPEQKVAAKAMLAHENGVLAATTVFGKTVVAAWLIAQRGVSTLVLVHRRQLLDHWIERLATFLGMPAKAIGRIGRRPKPADRAARRRNHSEPRPEGCRR